MLSYLNFIINVICLPVLIFSLFRIPESFVQSESAPTETCYYMAGCYSQDHPWVSALRPFPPPRSPPEINVRFFLLTRNSHLEWPVTNFEVMQIPGFMPNDISLRLLDFRSDRIATVFIIHGFSASIESAWMAEMANAYLSRKDVNVFLVDWGGGARHANYLQVAANTRVVGFIVSKFLSYLIEKKNLDPTIVHFIGHSLGAHISGYAGKSVPGILRITALDPAQIGFEGCPPEVRLNSTDATFIDALHTNGKPTVPLFGLGFVTPIGDVDFFFNGGFYQPGCGPTSLDPVQYPTALHVAELPVEVISEFLSCSHSKSIEYFKDAIQNTECVMWGHQPSYLVGVLNFLTFGRIQKYLEDLRRECNLSACSPVGLETIYFPAEGSFHVTTNKSPSYCLSDNGITDKMLMLLYQSYPSA